jgi:RNA recognition motif-containing protein
VEDAIVMRDRTTGKHRGFGCITFTDVESVQRGLKEDLELYGRKMDVKLAVPEGNNRDRGGDEPSRELSNKKIFVGGLNPETTKVCLLSHAFPVPGLRFFF